MHDKSHITRVFLYRAVSNYPLTDFIALYGVLLAGAIVFALVFIRPRVERLLVAGRVKVAVASKSALG